MQHLPPTWQLGWKMFQDKPPKSSCYKCQQLSHWAALCPKDWKTPGSEPAAGFQILTWEWRGPIQSAPLQEISVTRLQQGVQMNAAGRTITFLLDTRATYSVLTFFSGPFSSWNCTVLGVDGKPISRHSTPPLCCLWDGYSFIQAFFICLNVQALF